MLTIRFARVGKRNKAQFKIMLQEHTAAPGGRHVEILGSHDPHQKVTTLKEDRIKYWLSQGAQATDSVHNLLVSKGLISEKKRAVKIPKKAVEAAPDGEKTEASAQEAKPETAVTAEAKQEESKPEEKKETEAKEETKSE